MLAFRIGTVKNSKNFFRVFGPARVMIAGVEKESSETMTSSESDIGVRDYAKGSPFDQSLVLIAARNMGLIILACSWYKDLAVIGSKTSVALELHA